jgi:hypothetical protein
MTNPRTGWFGLRAAHLAKPAWIADTALAPNHNRASRIGIVAPSLAGAKSMSVREQKIETE